VQRIGERLDWAGTLQLLGRQADPGAGDHPWRSTHPKVLNTTASERLGYSPEGRALELLTQEIDWITEQISVRWPIPDRHRSTPQPRYRWALILGTFQAWSASNGKLLTLPNRTRSGAFPC
jgi:hypothetical protein